jgi:hypothetical protein
MPPPPFVSLPRKGRQLFVAREYGPPWEFPGYATALHGL